ncbi:unnamed protein product [marine sediment metagenome]|uniref:Uncharacterized protein n=1 Tax=marine sediment metagenome TaxID=412755 RepID=X0UIN4_9ZZZZ
MQSDEKLWEICKEIYREMFKDANPSADFDELIKSCKAKEKDFFLKYYLPIERQVEIVDRICDDHKIRGYDKRKISHEVHFGCSPNSSEKTWKEANKT